MVTGGWVWGQAKQTCDQACAARKQVCYSYMQSTINSLMKFQAALKEAGGSCKSGQDGKSHRDYAGAPFTNSKDKNKCYFLTPGATSSCTANDHANHRPLCYCTQAPP